jgi:hypothetical protein
MGHFAHAVKKNSEMIVLETILARPQCNLQIVDTPNGLLWSEVLLGILTPYDGRFNFRGQR